MTVSGLGFGTDTTVTFGGSRGQGVVVSSSSTLTAVTPVHSAGPADVVVTSAGTAKTLVDGYTFVAPTGTNAPPVVQSLTATGSRSNEPPGYANVSELIGVTALVTDNETPVSQLTFTWSANRGAFSGTGPTTTWQAPSVAGATTLHLDVVEHYLAADPSGLPIDQQNTTSGQLAVDVHDEGKEIGDMAVDFLQLFSQSSVGPDQVLHNFQDGCGNQGEGKAKELSDTTHNRQNFVILSWSVGVPRVTVQFSSFSPFRSNPADGWAGVDVHWLSQCIGGDWLLNGCQAAGGTRDDRGIDWVTTHYDPQTRRWWLCDSDYEGQSSTSSVPWLR